jgi:hypothetical protein
VADDRKNRVLPRVRIGRRRYARAVAGRAAILLLGGVVLAALGLLPAADLATASEEQFIQKINELNQTLIAERMRAAAAERRAVAAEALVRDAEQALQSAQTSATDERKRADNLAARVRDLEQRIRDLEAKAAVSGAAQGATPTPPAPATPPTPQAGSATPVPDVVPGAPGSQVRYIIFPPCKAGALGLIVAGETKFAGAVQGARQVRVVPHEAGDHRLVTVDPAPTLDLVKFACAHPQKGKIVVATLAVKGEVLVWTWKEFSPAGMKEALDQLDNLIDTSIVELLGDGKVLARYQAAPAEAEVRVGRGAPMSANLPKLPDGARFEGSRPGDGWAIESPDADTLRFTFGDQAFTATLNRQAATVQVLWQATQAAAGGDGELRQMQDDLRQYEADLEALKKGGDAPAPTRPQRRPSAVAKDPDDSTNKEKLIRTHIESLKKDIAEYQRKRQTPPPKGAPDVTKCGGQVVLPNGCVLVRIKFKP